ncbi:MAG: hypothetical protein EDM05_62695 [Leptolyngbya sp. IPPAS B-1204]|nr:MAG: hypothetical protein EDM05_13160 [Leptolyngbya sp. IPPAS B-1204]
MEEIPIHWLAAERLLGNNHPLQFNSEPTQQQPVQPSLGDLPSAVVPSGVVSLFSVVPQLNSLDWSGPVLDPASLSSSAQDILTGRPSDAPLVHSDVASLNLNFTQPFNKPGSSTEETLSAAVKMAAQQLEAFLAAPAFSVKLQQAFGGPWTVEAGRAALSQLLSSNITTHAPLGLEILPTASSAETSVQGAFSAETKTIYLFKDFLSGQIDHPQAVAAVLLEEIGHYLDA